MADPTFPFEIGRRDGRLTRPIMCRRCARWTAFDGTSWRHADGTDACVDPEALHNQQPTKEATMATRTKATTKKRSAPKGMTAVQQAEFDRAAAQAEVMKTIPAEFAAACELIPQVGMPYASAEERTKVAALIKRANAFAKEAGIAPESIDLVAQFNNYINHTTERKATMTTTKTTKGTTTTTRTNGAASTAITEAEIDAFVAKHEKDGGKMTKGAIVEAIRNSGAKIGYPGGDYLVTVLAKRTPAEKPAKATPAKAAVKPAAKAPKAAEKAVRAEGNLTRKTVTPLPKKAAKKSTAAAMRKPTTKATKRVR